jgi:hypothetical protein
MGGACISRLAAQATFLYGGQCQRCGQPKPLDTHWMKPCADGGTDTLDNLVVLCRGCHTRAHDHPDDADLLAIWSRNRTALIQIGYLKCERARARLEGEHAADSTLIEWCGRTFARDKYFHTFHIPDARLLEELLFLRKRLGRPLRLSDVARHGHYALSTFENRFYRFVDLIQAINDEMAARKIS